jgi:hypothetical protein
MRFIMSSAWGITARSARRAGLRYSWSAANTEFTMSAPGSAIARFSRVGVYAVRVEAIDAQNNKAVAEVEVDVPERLGSLWLEPADAAVKPGATQVFTAVALDQFGNPASNDVAVRWNVNGGGTVDDAGHFVAGSSEGGPFLVSAWNEEIRGTASLRVSRLAPEQGSSRYAIGELGCASSGPGLPWVALALLTGLSRGRRREAGRALGQEAEGQFRFAD